jgi:RNA recognition motif-containing protein
MIITSELLCTVTRFYDKRDAEDALDAMDGRLLDGRELRVQMARYGRPSSPYRRHSRRRRWVYSNNSVPYSYYIIIRKLFLNPGLVCY